MAQNMPNRLNSTLILVAVFGFGLAAGICGMVWAWPGLRAHYFPRHRESYTQFLTRTLKLSTQQQSQVQVVLKDTQDRRRALTVEFQPQYAKVCSDFVAIRKQEGDAYAPIRQQELDKLHAVFTDAQWQTFQQGRAQNARNQPPRQTDLCRRLLSPSGGGGGGRGSGRGGRGGSPPSGPPGPF